MEDPSMPSMNSVDQPPVVPEIIPEPRPTRLNDADEYLKNHRVMELFNNITSQLIYERPEDPKAFMIKTLEKLKKAKATRFDLPCLFDETNIVSIFGMLDPTNRGYITVQQYKEALVTLGITNFNQEPKGADLDRIAMEIFVKEAKEGLKKASATYKEKEK